MKRILSTLILIILILPLQAQVQKDLARSVPLWFEYDLNNSKYMLKWLPDENAFEYRVNNMKYEPYVLTSLIEKLDGSVDSFELATLESAMIHDFHIQKRSNNSAYNGYGLITAGIELPMVEERGKCLVYVRQHIFDSLDFKIMQLINDMEMDGWHVDYLLANDTMNVSDVKAEILNWYEEEYENSQALLLLGNIPVPYSGNTAYDGHTNHDGAWVADSYYADMDGNWTDSSVNNNNPSRDENKNIPGDGKFDQSVIPGKVELEVGRVDFSKLPAFALDEIGLTEKYLDKNHAFRTAEYSLPERALIENNFASFDEGFGQSGWRNFTTFFGGDQVMEGNYEAMVDSNAYLWSYACGGGSYTSCGGIGNTANLWAAKEIQSVFTMTFGSYFGDWDIQNNFLRSALASGKILTNVWSGRPIWQFYHMALGKHIGYSVKFSQNANSSLYGLGYGAHSAHVSLLGDPTLRMHPLKPVNNLVASSYMGDVTLNWDSSPDATYGYLVYRKTGEEKWKLLAEGVNPPSYIDRCLNPETTYEYMVKAIKLQYTGSGSYFNTSQGMKVEILVEDNPNLLTYFQDADGDGYGNAEVDSLACLEIEGYVDNDTDCDDTNPAINPAAEDIPDNDIDEDCNGEDASGTASSDIHNEFSFYPNPAQSVIYFDNFPDEGRTFRIYGISGKKLMEGKLKEQISVNSLKAGSYILEIKNQNEKQTLYKQKLIITK